MVSVSHHLASSIANGGLAYGVAEADGASGGTRYLPAAVVRAEQIRAVQIVVFVLVFIRKSRTNASRTLSLSNVRLYFASWIASGWWTQGFAAAFGTPVGTSNLLAVGATAIYLRTLTLSLYNRLDHCHLTDTSRTLAGRNISQYFTARIALRSHAFGITYTRRAAVIVLHSATVGTSAI